MLEGKRAVVKVSIIVLAVFAVLLIASLVVPVLGGEGEIGTMNTHTATIIVTPSIVAGGINDPDQEFNVEVCNTGGNDIHEFRIYYEWEDFTDFTDVQCQSKTGWDKVILNTLWGHACVYSSTDNSYNIKEEYCEDFKFTAETPEEECCRELRFETRDTNDFWRYIDTNICVDATVPTITKSFSPEGTYKIDGDLEWIDTATYITIDYVDPEPHPSGVVEKKYINLLSSDLIKRFEINDCEDEDRPCWDIDFCEENLKRYAEQIPDEEWTDYTVPFQKEGESCHILYMKAKDGVGNENTEINCFFVDKTAPIGEKTIGEPKVECDGEIKEYCAGIPEQGSCYNYNYEQCLIIPSCEWMGIDDFGAQVISGHCEGTPESCSVIEDSYKCDEETPGCEWISEEVKECDYWVRDDNSLPGTPITLTCTDPEPHPSGDEEVCYKVSFDGEPVDLTDEYCEGDLEIIDEDSEYDDEWCCVDSPETIIFQEDSLHDLEYFCRDAVDKKSKIDIEWFKVDSQHPIIKKNMFGSYLGDCPSGTDLEHGDCYVADDGTSGVEISVEDDDTYPDCVVDNVQCRYELWWEDQPDKPIEVGKFTDYQKITFNEDSTHILKIWCEDALGNPVYDEETFLVDSTPPITTKTYVGPQYPDPTIEGQTPYPHWITSSTLVNLTAEDEKVGVDKIYWRNTIVENRYCEDEYSGCQYAEGSGNFVEYTSPFNKPQESCHLIEYYAVDRLGNEETIKKQCVFVENTPPETTKSVGDPKVACDVEDPTDCDYYITQQTPITLNCKDQDPHPVDHSAIKYRYRFAKECDDLDDATWTDWIDPDGVEPVEKTIYFPEDSCHELEYYCVDALGNEETHKYEIDIVDTQAPEIEKEIVGPSSGNCLPKDKDDVCYIDGVTNISVTATDPNPHPVNQVTCEWWYTLDDLDVIYGPYTTFPIHFPEETQHNLVIECKDALGNTARDEETFYVDKTAPTTTKTYGTPLVEREDGKWITSNTPITLTVDDTGPHKSGIKETKYRVTRIDDIYCNKILDTYCAAAGSGDWQTYTEEPFKIDEQSCHKIEYYSVDNVDKKEETKYQCVYVDNSPPIPIKEVYEPKTKWDGKDSIFYEEETKNCWVDGEDSIDCWKVTLDTLISMTCTDPTPHPVDNEKICFNVELDGDDYTDNEEYSYCDEYGGEMNDGYCCLEQTIENFKFLESSEHNLKFYCEDALKNRGDIDEEKFKVEGNEFEIELNKKWNLISVPVVLLNDDPKEVFENVDVENCIQSVWTYDGSVGEEGEWYVWIPGDAPDNLKIKLGFGFWVIANEDCMLTIGGSLLSPGRTPPSRKLVPGWNLIGYYGMDDPENGFIEGYYGPAGNGGEAYCSLYSLVNTNALIPTKRWSSLYDYWQLREPLFEGYEMCDKLDPGAGYWIHMPADLEEYRYAPSTGCPTAFWDLICGIAP